ncbi:FG-GAP-like repeat-containing protein [Nannocystis bainbridge]|uniref:VCBS repeat-containing protein n=1 Tax=Nannocystis bainbridge TaxID=2995303 RepID=A0ABT5E4X7_9BACT|nr:VCBS repeat-containing protein [Nannocystis bainbridge]MDC0719988.1 VCBS repeat-containing protein [Nannocystis bainbridge]
MTSPWTWLARALGLGVFALACEPADPCQRTGAGALCLDLANARTYGWGLSTASLAVADLDADGVPDIVGAGDARGTVGAMWGRPGAHGVQDMFDGTWTSWWVGAPTRDLVVADLDGDGRLDVATALPESGEIAVLRGRGGRELGEPQRIAVDAGPRRLVAADLDGAGPPELVVVNETAGTLTIVRDLVADPPLAVGPGARDLAVADLDGDGHRDVAVAVTEAGAIQVLLGDGHGGLVTGPRHAVGLAPTDIVAADLDGDGAIDLATLDVLADDVTILHGDGRARLRARTRWPVDLDPVDLAVSPDSTGQPVLYVLSEVTGNVQRVDPRRGVVLTASPRTSPSQLLVGDLDGDGRDALLYARGGDGLGELAPERGLRLEALWQRERTGTAFPVDLEADGVDELLIDLDDQPEPDPATEPSRVVALVRGPEPLDLELETGLADALQGAVAADFDGDGRNDLVLWTRSHTAVLLRRPDGSFAPGVSAPYFGEPEEHAVVRGGDRARLVFAGPGGLSFLHLGPEGALVVEAEVSLQGRFRGLSTIDLAGDGRTDLVVHVAESLVLVEGLDPDATRVIELPALADSRALVLVPGDHAGPDALVCTSDGLVHAPDLFGPSPGDTTLLDPDRCQQLGLFDLDGDGRRTEVVSLRSSALLGDLVRVHMTPWQRDDGAWRSLAPRTVVHVQGSPRLIAQDGGRMALLRNTTASDMVAEDMSFGPALLARPRAQLDVFSDATLGDFDGDGALDVFVRVGRPGNTGRLGFAFGDGDGGFGPTELRGGPGRDDLFSYRARAVQLDDDAGDEIVLLVHSQDQTRSLLVRLDLEGGELRRRDLLQIPSFWPAELLVGDLDGDGRRDLLVLATVPGGGPATGGGLLPRAAFLRNLDGGLAPARWQDLDGIVGFNSQLADLDGDGRLDLYSNGLGMQVAFGRGDGRFGPMRTWSPLAPDEIAVADIDRDGRPDVLAVVFDYDTPPPHNLQVLHLRGGATAGPPRAIFSGGLSVDVADLDGDGELEVLVVDLEGALQVGHHRDGTFRFERHPLPGALGYVRVRDLDGDGLPDITLLSSAAITTVRQLP